ncbi:MAG: hypothetical protein LBU80_02780 [Rikenellaceae bacterium]|nr:hypothetical protein [Rikenellaceae bacterium]
MKPSFGTKARAAAAVLLATATMFSGCKKYDDSDVRDQLKGHEDRLTTLEDRIESGALIKSVTPITEAPGGWRIEFTGGTPSSIDIMNGAASSNPDPTDGVSPLIEVRTNPDGSVSVWYNVTAGYPDSGWTDTGTDIRGPQGSGGGTGPQGPAGINPKVRVHPNGNGTVTIQYNITAGYPADGWVDAGEAIALDSNPDDRAAILSIVDNAPLGTVTITMNDGDPDGEPPVPHTEYTFAKASGAVRFELVGFNDKVTITEGATGRIRFVVNPSNAYVPTGTGTALDGKWQLNQTGTRETRASYVTPPTNFALVSVLPEEGKPGQYIATIECLTHDPAIAEYAMSLVLDTGAGTAESPGLVSSPTFVLSAEVRTEQTYTPTSWDDVQSAVDGMHDGDILDLSGLTDYPDNTDSPASGITKTITVAKDITITAQMDPVLGQFGDGTEYEPFHNVNFVLSGNPTVTFHHVEFNFSVNKSPLISGEGNVVVDESQIIHAATPQSVIHVDGDVTVRGTMATLWQGHFNSTSHVGASGVDTDGTTPEAAIRACNVTIEGGSVAGCSTHGASSNGGMAIAASGDVTITGELIPFDNRYIQSTMIMGGSVINMGGYGGYAIRAAGKVTIDGGVLVYGGNGAGDGEIGGSAIQAIGGVEITGEYIRSAYSDAYVPTTTIRGGNGTNGGNGGHGIDAAGGIAITGGVYVTGGDGSGGEYSTGGYGIVAADCDVTLKGEKYDPGDGFWFSLRVRSGNGDYSTGTPFRFQGDPGIVRTLTATTAQISDVNATKYCAPFAMDLKDNDRAILDDCRLGWYRTIPLFQSGYYKITNPVAVWGTNVNATPLEGNQWDGVPTP